MKKLILTSATVLFIGLSAFACDGSKCTNKCENKNNQKECKKDASCEKKCSGNQSSVDFKCKKDNENCKKQCTMNGEKKGAKPGDNK